MTGEHELHFCHDVFREELEEIIQRRSAAGLPYDELARAARLLEELHEAKRAHAAARRSVSPARLWVSRRLQAWRPASRWAARLAHLLRADRVLSARRAMDDCAQELAARGRAVGAAWPSARLGLVGLALSGGGVRSATFNPGVLQALGERGVLRFVDYLSTVSGGGYAGACLTSPLSAPAGGGSPEHFPLLQEPGRPPNEALKRLRASANHLTPPGVLRGVELPVALILGMLINSLIFLGWPLVMLTLAPPLFGALVAGAIAISVLLAISATRVSRRYGKALYLLLGVAGPLGLGVAFLWVRERVRGDSGLGVELSVLGVLVLFSYFVNANSLSLHRLYRTRLTGAYLPAGDRRLSDLSPPGTVAPYHLLNATLNVPGSPRPELRSRKADFFVLRKRFCGSSTTGFCPTRRLERADPRLGLGTAMAVSGAALAPERTTSGRNYLAFIMTLLNVRLGYWLPNPMGIKRPSGLARGLLIRSGVGPFYPMKELLGRMHERTWHVNLSDGGHIENLGAYALLRRRCKHLIVCDAEADPDLSFGGLARLVRYARMDLGVDIRIDLAELRKASSGLSRRHIALGDIDFGEGEPGKLLYLKACLSGDESEDILEYGRRTPAFPHETTADQFFDETQFEAYRALGKRIGDGLFAGSARPGTGRRTWRAGSRGWALGWTATGGHAPRCGSGQRAWRAARRPGAPVILPKPRLGGHEGPRSREVPGTQWGVSL